LEVGYWLVDSSAREAQAIEPMASGKGSSLVRPSMRWPAPGARQLWSRISSQRWDDRLFGQKNPPDEGGLLRRMFAGSSTFSHSTSEATSADNTTMYAAPVSSFNHSPAIGCGQQHDASDCGPARAPRAEARHPFRAAKHPVKTLRLETTRP